MVVASFVFIYVNVTYVSFVLNAGPGAMCSTLPSAEWLLTPFSVLEAAQLYAVTGANISDNKIQISDMTYACKCT